MALRAFLAERAFMRLLLFMAGDALAGRFPKLLGRLMAAIAGKRFVRAFQIEIGKLVAKCFFVELHDIGVPALVIGMAMLAFGIDSIGTPPVQAALLLAISRDVLVTGDA